MGHLAEAKRKKKLGPSHHGASAWSKSASESSIGFKLMASMGWAPGKGLGTDLHGEKDNIKYSLKDDLLGVGAKKEYGGGVWRGMAEVDDLYKKLDVGSGNSTPKVEVQEVEDVQEVKLRGGWKMNFHVGDTYTSSFNTPDESEVERVDDRAEGSESSEQPEKKSKKRKRDGEEGKERVAEKKSKKEKSSKKARHTEKDADDSTTEDNAAQPELEKSKSKRKKEEKAVNYGSVEITNGVNGAPIIDSSSLTRTKKDKSKDKKKDKKSKSKQAKEESEESEVVDGKDQPKKEKKDKSRKKRKDHSSKSKEADDISMVITSEAVVATSSSSTATPSLAPSDSERSTPIPRHMHRARFLAMKKASVMDQNALREILGVAA